LLNHLTCLFDTLLCLCSSFGTHILKYAPFLSRRVPRIVPNILRDHEYLFRFSFVEIVFLPFFLLVIYL